MSQENVEIVRRGYEAYARGDMEAMLEGLDPEMTTYRAEPDGATFTGPGGLMEAIGTWVEDFAEFSLTPEEFIDANEGQVLVRVHQKAVGDQSGVPIEADYWFVHTVRRAKLVRLDMFANRRHALEAAGLPE